MYILNSFLLMLLWVGTTSNLLDRVVRVAYEPRLSVGSKVLVAKLSRMIAIEGICITNDSCVHDSNFSRPNERKICDRDHNRVLVSTEKIATWRYVMLRPGAFNLLASNDSFPPQFGKGRVDKCDIRPTICLRSMKWFQREFCQYFNGGGLANIFDRDIRLDLFSRTWWLNEYGNSCHQIRPLVNPATFQDDRVRFPAGAGGVSHGRALLLHLSQRFGEGVIPRLKGGFGNRPLAIRNLNVIGCNYRDYDGEQSHDQCGHSHNPSGSLRLTSPAPHASQFGPRWLWMIVSVGCFLFEILGMALGIWTAFTFRVRLTLVAIFLFILGVVGLHASAFILGGYF